jgi:hypothetical protein
MVSIAKAKMTSVDQKNVLIDAQFTASLSYCQIRKLSPSTQAVEAASQLPSRLWYTVWNSYSILNALSSNSL